MLGSLLRMAEREEMEFGDLVFGVDEDVDVEEEEEEEEDEVFGRNSREGFHQRSISALTVGVRRMNCDVPSRITGRFFLLGLGYGELWKVKFGLVKRHL